jgi:hypothetical protein
MLRRNDRMERVLHGSSSERVIVQGNQQRINHEACLILEIPTQMIKTIIMMPQEMTL